MGVSRGELDSIPVMHPTITNAHANLLTTAAWRNLGKFLYIQIVITQRAVGAVVFELVAPPLEQIYSKPKQLGLVLENTY